MISSSSVTEAIAPIQSAGDLHRSLTEETAELESLLGLLRKEQQALQERDMESVHALAVAKNQKLSRLGAFGVTRARFLHACGLPADYAGMEAYLARTRSAHPVVDEGWKRLLANAAEARQVNAVNGRLIAAQMRFVSGALVALQQTTSQLVCYGADGQTRSRTASRSLASA